MQMNRGVWKTRKSGIRTGEINECFKLGSMININTPPPFSTFLARWMMVLGDWVWDDALIIQSILAYVCRPWQHRGIKFVKMWAVRLKIWVCYGCYYTEQRSNQQRTRDRLTGKNSKSQKFSNLLKICRIHFNRFLALMYKKELQNQFRNQAWRPISSKLKPGSREVFLKHYILGSLK